MKKACYKTLASCSCFLFESQSHLQKNKGFASGFVSEDTSDAWLKWVDEGFFIFEVVFFFYLKCFYKYSNKKRTMNAQWCKQYKNEEKPFHLGKALAKSCERNLVINSCEEKPLSLRFGRAHETFASIQYVTVNFVVNDQVFFRRWIWVWCFL